MRILDRERYWAYLKAYVICFTALVGLWVVIDAFSNFDEFTKRASGASAIFKVMGRYYLVRTTEMYDKLCGVIGMMAAVFTVTWMQKNNELLAMLAAGVSTQRVIRPVILSAVVVSGLAVANQELIMPEFADELQKSHADDGSATVRISGHLDSNKIYIHGNEADRKNQTILMLYATFPVELFGALIDVEAKQARYIPVTEADAPLRGGWLLRGASMHPPVADGSLDKEILVKLDNDLRLLAPSADPSGLPREGRSLVVAAVVGKALHIRAFDNGGKVAVDADETTLPEHARKFEELGKELEGLWPPHELTRGEKDRVLAAVKSIVGPERLKADQGFPPPLNLPELGGETYFLRSTLTFKAVTRKRNWYQYANTVELVRGLTDPTNESEKQDIAVFLHNRLLRPCLALALLFMSLPQVLGGFGRNMFVSLGISLGSAALFYAVCFVAQYLGSHSEISPELSAWGPLIGFGTFAMLRWDAIRT